MLELLNKINNSNLPYNHQFLLVDVRTPEEYALGSVDGAINIPLNTLDQEFSVFENKENVVVFCRSGARSRNAKILLQQNGFQNIINGGPWQNVQSALEEIIIQK